MAATLTTIGGILKDFYVGPVREQINQEANVRALMKSTTVSWNGQQCVVPLHTSRNSGVGAIAESGTLPTAGSQGFAKLNITAKFVYGRAQITGPAMASAKSSKGSFDNWMAAEMDRLAQDVANIENQFAVHGGSVLGFVWEKAAAGGATVMEYAGRTSTTELPLTLGGAATTAQLVRLDTYAVLQNVAAGTATQVNVISANSITFNVGYSLGAGGANPQNVPAGVVMAVVLDAASTIVGGVAGAFANEPNGITSNLAAITLYGQSKAAIAELRSNFLLIDPVNDVYAALDLKRIQAAFDLLSEKGGEPDLILTHPAMRSEYTDLLVGTNAANLMVESGNKGKSGDAGFAGGLGYNGKPIMISRHAHKGTFFMLIKKHWATYELDAGSWMDDDGSVLKRVANTDAYEATWRHYYETACDRYNVQCVLTGIQF